MEHKKAFKISQLDRIRNIDDDDLLLISDNEAGKFFTKSISVKQLADSTLDRIAENEGVQAQISNIVSAATEEYIQELTEERIIQILQYRKDIVLGIIGEPSEMATVIDGNML